MTEKYGFVYIWFDKRNKKYYVGCHWGTEDDGYICSSNWMRNARKRRPNDFKRRILKRIYTNRKDTFAEEQRYLDMIKPEEVRTRYYNLHITVGHWTAGDNTLNIKEKISIKTKEAMQRPEVREKYLKGLESRTNVESRPNQSESMIKYWEEKSPVENRQTWLDKDSVELKEIHRNNTKKLWENPKYRAKVIRSKPFVADGVVFELLTEAANKYNITPAAIRHRIKSASFKDWYYV